MRKPYKIAAYQKSGDSFIVLLDGKPARTPGGKPLSLPVERLGCAVAEEWQMQGDVIRKESMPLTQIAVIAIDLVMPRREEVTADMLAYADTDLVCYRAGDVPALGKQQAELLDPLLAWAEERFGAAFMITDGVMPVKQPSGTREKLLEVLMAYDDWKFAVLAASVKPLGSLIIALAFVEGRIGAEEAFRFSHLEEMFETQSWGRDEEKEARLGALAAEIEAAARFLSLL